MKKDLVTKCMHLYFCKGDKLHGIVFSKVILRDDVEKILTKMKKSLQIIFVENVNSLYFIYKLK